jgi:hypothetical protein
MEVEFVATKVDDSLRWFIEEKMKLMGEYKQEEADAMFEREHHTYVHINKNGTIDSFGMLHKVDGIYLFGYTWHDSSREGRRSFLRGLEFLKNKYSFIGIQDHNLKVNKIKRMVRG